MPQRSNKFQELIASIERSLAGEDITVTVEESKLLEDRITHEMREVDIYITITQKNGRVLHIAVECRDHGRKADVTWVETVHTKHEHLPIDKTILVNSAGFLAPAIEKAKFFDMDTLTLEQAKVADWSNMLLNKFIIWRNRLEPTGMSIRSSDLTEQKKLQAHIATLPSILDLKVMAEDGKITTIKDIFQAVILDQKVLSDLSDQMETGGSCTIDYQFPHNSFTLDADSQKIPLIACKFNGNFIKTKFEIPLAVSKYGEAQVIHGRVDTDDGDTYSVVTTEVEGTNPHIEISIDPKELKKKSSADSKH